MMPDEMKEEMDEKPEEGAAEETDGADGPVSEEYIEEARDGVAGLIPEDFEMMDLKVPTKAKDGEMVSILLTGKAAGGRLTGVYGAEFSPKGPEKKKGRLTILIGDGNQEEE